MFIDILTLLYVVLCRKAERSHVSCSTELLGYSGLGHGAMVCRYAIVSCLGHLEFNEVKSGNAALPQDVARKDAPKVCSS